VRFFAIIAFFFLSLAARSSAEFYRGVNLSSAEFGENNLPGVYNTHYIYPTRAEVDYFTGKGMNIFRLPFRWERLQSTAYGALNQTELGRLNSFVQYATGKRAYVVLDPHNYARYYHTNLVGSATFPNTTLSNFWYQVAGHYSSNPRVFFGLINEPHTMPTEQWRDAANACIAAIRHAGATNLILVPGNAWSGAHGWNQSWYGTPNAVAMRAIRDPGSNFAFEVHQYLDADSSGTSSTCVNTNIGVQRIAAFQTWCRTNGFKAFLGEFGVATNATCLEAMKNLVQAVESNKDVWIGWSYWAAGPWWGEYIYTLEPRNGRDRLQMDWLEPFLAPAPPRLVFLERWMLQFFSEPGAAYQMEITPALGSSNWVPYGSVRSGGVQVVELPRSAQSNYFFRLKAIR
jgi:endoglucanase